MLICDFHIHTEHSSDCGSKLEKLVDRCIEVGIDCIAITDHNEIKGALELQKYAPFKVIVGEEIRTTEGEIIGLFLQEKIKPGLTPEETIRQIKNQQGLVVVPHPFDRYRSSALDSKILYQIKDQIDIVEIYNSRNIHRIDDSKAEDFALQYNKCGIAGSDAHFCREVGNVKLMLQDFNTKEGFLAALKAPIKKDFRRSGLVVHCGTKFKKWTRF